MTKKRKEKQPRKNIEEQQQNASEASFGTTQLQEKAFRDTESVFSQMLSHSE